MKFALLVTTLTLLCRFAGAQDLAVVGAKVYTSPEAQPVSGATILIRAGKIAAVGPRLVVPPGVPALSCQGCVVLAGFWNNHVHFMEAKWNDAAHLPAAQLTLQLQEMLTGAGFTTVVDTGSDPVNTIALRSRIESGEVAGPHIYTAGSPLYPVHAIPYYLKDLPPRILALLNQPATPAEATAAVLRNIGLGTDIVKLFTGSIVAPDHIVPMALPIVEAAVTTGHQHGQLVFTHPTNLAGIRVALAGGVDVLAHAPDLIDGIDDSLLAQVVARHMAMIPTLKLFSEESDIAGIRAIVAGFHRLGGQLMFGTDTGFLTDYNLDEEYKQLFLAGLSYRDVIAMLTTAPAQRFGVGDREGRIAPGMEGDLTVLSADPAQEGAAAFTQVRYTIRKGRVVFSRQ